MTDNEIIKALEEELGTALIINHRFEESNDTENPDDHRFIALLSRTIKLINRQKAEIENCYEFIEQLKKARNIWDDKCTHQNAEIERLQKLLDDKCDRCIAKDKAESVKEFAERLKEYVESYDVTTGYRVTIVQAVEEETIDNLVKEMAGEG